MTVNTQGGGRVARSGRGGREREEGLVVGDAEGREEVGVKLAGLEAAEADDVPEGALEVATELEAAVGGEGGPAVGAGEQDGQAGAGSGGPEAEGAVVGGGGERLAVGAEGDTIDAGRMTLEDAKGVARGSVP